RRDVGAADDALLGLRGQAETLEASIKEARAAHDELRAAVSELDVARATAEADLAHLAHTCEDAVNTPLDQVIVEVEQMEAEGSATPNAAVIDEADESDEEVRLKADATSDLDVDGRSVRLQADLEASTARTLSAEEAIGALRGKIERLGPVNMMAIEQF